MTAPRDPLHGEHREGCNGNRPDWCATCDARARMGDGFKAEITRRVKWGKGRTVHSFEKGQIVHVVDVRTEWNGIEMWSVRSDEGYLLGFNSANAKRI